jgi:hypothetical protein
MLHEEQIPIGNTVKDLFSVIRIRIRRIHTFLGTLDPDPLARVTNPNPSIIKQNSKKNLDTYCFGTSF